MKTKIKRVERDDDVDEIEVCETCGFFADGVKHCPYCGELKCPVCGCYCCDSGDVWEFANEVVYD